MRTIRSLALAVATLLAAGLVLAACGDDDDDGSARDAEADEEGDGGDGDDDAPVIVVTGHGNAEGTPDLMTVHLSIDTHGTTAEAAMAQNNDLAQKAIDALEFAGVAEKDMQTANLNVYPTFDEKGRRITGYNVSNALTAKLRDLDLAGTVIDAASKAAGDAIRLNGIAFSIDEPDALLDTARAGAVERALAQAQVMAEAAGTELGKVRSIEETTAVTPSPEELGRRVAFDEAAAGVPIQPGTQELGVDVTVTIELEQ